MFVHKCRESKSARNPNMCKSPTQKNFSSFVCKSFQSPGMQSFYLHMAQQQVPIAIQSWCCCCDCAQPPGNLEVNPPQTSTSMQCWLWVSVCLRGCLCVNQFFINALHLYNFWRDTHESLNLLHFRVQALQSMVDGNWRNTNFSESMESWLQQMKSIWYHNISDKVPPVKTFFCSTLDWLH